MRWIAYRTFHQGRIFVVLRIGSQPPDERTLRARSGRQVPCEVRPELVLAPDIVRIRAQELANWSHDRKIRSISNHFYNCVGMVFASRRDWIEIDHIYLLLEEDGYRKIHLNQAMIGDVVLYKLTDGAPSHVGLIVGIENFGATPNIKVMSKWGRDAEFIHFIDDVPVQLGRASEYYTDRPL